jgi:hypothetical protein
LIEYYKVDSEGLELGGEAREMSHRACEPVELGHGECVKTSASRIGQEAVQRRAPVLRAGDTVVDVFAGDLKASGLGLRAHGVELGSTCCSVVDSLA